MTKVCMVVGLIAFTTSYLGYYWPTIIPLAVFGLGYIYG